MAATTGPEEDLLTVGAREAFWNIKGAALDEALKDKGLSRPSKVFHKVCALTQHPDVLGPLTDAELLRILKKRVADADDIWANMLQSEELQAEMSAQDKELAQDVMPTLTHVKENVCNNA